MPISFASLNYWAILVSAVVYWLLGALWFSVLGNVWSKEVEKHGIKIRKPAAKEMVTKFILTFILNFIVAWGVAALVSGLNIQTFGAALGLGLILGICISAATLATTFVWESRNLKLTIIDVGYPILGIIISALILTFWR